MRSFSRRVRGEGLISSPRASAGVRVLGIEPERERNVTRIADSITAGAYLDGVRRRVLLGEELARRLEVEVGDKVVVSVQDLDGELTGEALRVAGLFKTPSRELDRGTVFLHIDAGQALLGLGEAVSEIVGAQLIDAEGRSWEERQPLLVYMIDSFDQMAMILYAAVFIAMAFGIANVLLMTVYERTREIGIMRAIGFGPGRLVATILAEALSVTAAGLALGFVAAVAAVFSLSDGLDLSSFADGLEYFGVGSRIYPVLRSEDFSMPIGVAFFTAAIASAWPAWRAVRLRPAEAVRHT